MICPSHQKNGFLDASSCFKPAKSERFHAKEETSAPSSLSRTRVKRDDEKVQRPKKTQTMPRTQIAEKNTPKQVSLFLRKNVKAWPTQTLLMMQERKDKIACRQRFRQNAARSQTL
jgi:hypothetical protein